MNIRAYENKDCNDIIEVLLQPKCQMCTLQLPYMSRDLIKKRLETPPENVHRLVYLVEQDGEYKAVGLVTLAQLTGARRHVGELGIFVHDDYHRQKIGSKLIHEILKFSKNWLGLKRIELTVFTNNQSALELYKKNGFLKEGTLKEFAYRDGNYIDAYMMSKIF